MERGRPFGELAVEHRYVTEAQLSAARAERARIGRGRFLAEVMLGAGLLTREGLGELLELGRGYREGDEDGALFGDVAVAKGYVSATDLFACLRDQRDDDVAGYPHARIGELLLDRGHLTPWELEDVLLTLADLASGSSRTGATPAASFSTQPFAPPGGRRAVAARARARQRVAERPTVARVMRAAPGETSPWASIAEARETAIVEGSRQLFVTELGELVGVLEIGDLADAPDDAMVERLVRGPAVAVAATASLDEAAALLAATGLECVPVTVGGLIVGAVGRDDLRAGGVSRERLPWVEVPEEELGVAG